MGEGGSYAVDRISVFGDVDIVAVCDVREEALKKCRDILAKKKLPPARLKKTGIYQLIDGGNFVV